MKPMIASLALILAVIASAALARPTLHPLAGQKIDFIPSASGDDALTLPVNIVAAEMANVFDRASSRVQIDVESDAGKQIIVFVRETGRRIGASGLLPETKATPFTPAFSFDLSFHEHVVPRVGAAFGPALKRGFTFGLAGPMNYPITYVTQMTLDITRADGRKASYPCETRVQGTAPMPLTGTIARIQDSPRTWDPLIADARKQCANAMFEKMYVDRTFFVLSGPAAPGSSPDFSSSKK